jgi:hypothetical protein
MFYYIGYRLVGEAARREIKSLMQYSKIFILDYNSVKPYDNASYLSKNICTLLIWEPARGST